jgi:hypothetical protein
MGANISLGTSVSSFILPFSQKLHDYCSNIFLIALPFNSFYAAIPTLYGVPVCACDPLLCSKNRHFVVTILQALSWSSVSMKE